MAPISTSLSSESFDFENLRIETSGPSTPIGRTAQLKRDPSSRRASQSGLDLVDAPADGGDDLLDDAHEMRLVLEQRRHRLEHAAALDEDVLVAVDEDVGDARVLEQGLEGAEPGHLVHHLGHEGVELLRVEGQALALDPIRDHGPDLAAELLFRQLLESGEVQFIEQLLVQAHLGVEQLLLAEEGAGGRLGEGDRRHRHRLRRVDGRRGRLGRLERSGGLDDRRRRDVLGLVHGRARRLDVRGEERRQGRRRRFRSRLGADAR